MRAAPNQWRYVGSSRWCVINLYKLLDVVVPLVTQLVGAERHVHQQFAKKPADSNSFQNHGVARLGNKLNVVKWLNGLSHN